MTKIPKEEEEIYTFKVLFLGDSSSGKVEFISPYCDEQFKEDTEITIGIDTKYKYLKRGDKRIQLII